MSNKNKLLTVLSDAEQEALYGLPDFDDAQRLEYLALTETELALASSRSGLHAQVYCVLQALKENKETGFTFLTTLCGIHFPEKKDNEFWVMYQLHNLFTNERIRVYSSASADDPVFASVTPLWAAANWMERETFDFYGLQFEGHPNLTRILNVDEMDYHPMRKEYKLEDDSRTDKDDTYFGR